MNNIVLKMNNKTSLFGKGRTKILECFYKFRNKEIYFSEILRETRLTQNTTLKHLKVLEEAGLIISIKKIGNTFYRVLNSPQIYALFAYFDYQRLNALPSARKRALLDFLDNLNIKPLIALVFGSTAKGVFEKESDIDLLLVYNKKEKKDEKTEKEIKAITGVSVQSFIIDYNYFKENLTSESDKVVTHAIKTGFVASGFDLFYKEALK